MSGGVINLNRARKARAWTEAKSRAAANRVRHGRTRAEREREAAEAARRAAALSGARLEPGPGEGPEG